MTWTPVATNVAGEIFALTIDPHNSNTLYAVTRDVTSWEVLRSIDCGSTWQDISLVENNLYSSSSLPPFVAYPMKNSAGGTTVTVASNFVDPHDSSNLYLLTELPSVSGDSNGLFRSTNSGASWTLSPVALGRARILSLGVPIK
jgi:hypothetical protein